MGRRGRSAGNWIVASEGEEDAVFASHLHAVLEYANRIWRKKGDHKIEIINLTPHAINILADGGTITIPPSGTIARCGEASEPAGEINGIPLVTKTYTEVTGLPDEAPGVYYIVSAMVRQALPDRRDLLSPGDLVRDDSGNVIGCRNLVCNLVDR